MLIFIDDKTNKKLLEELQKTFLKFECINLSEHDNEDIPSVINSSINEYTGRVLLNLCDLSFYCYNLIYFFSNRKNIFNIDLINMESLCEYSQRNIKQRYAENRYLSIYYGYLYSEYEGELNYNFITNLNDLVDLVNKFVKLYHQNKEKMLEKIDLLDFSIRYFQPNKTDIQPNIKIKSTYGKSKLEELNKQEIITTNGYQLFYDPDNYQYNFSFSTFYDNDLTNFYI